MVHSQLESGPVYPSLIEKLERAAVKFGNAVALKTIRPRELMPSELTFSEWAIKSCWLAGALQEHGVRPDDRVAIVSKPRPEWAVAAYATLLTGGIVAPIDPLLKPREVGRLLGATQAKAAFLDGAWLQELQRFRHLPRLITLDHPPSDAVPSFGEMVRANIEGRPEKRRHTDPAFLMTTSGTTGDPQPVKLTYENISSNPTNVLKVIELSADDRIVSIAPWNHIMGLLSLNAVLWRGFTLIYTSDHANLRALMKLERPTILLGVPKLLKAMIERLSRQFGVLYNVLPIGRIAKWKMGGQLRFIVTGSAPLDPRVEIELVQHLKISLINGYGLTETAPVLTANMPDAYRLGSVGRAIPSVELGIMWPNEEGIGEVVARGPNIMVGYERSEANPLDEEGWFHTGDLGYLDEDGYLFLKGRQKNVIVLSSGKNVYAEEVEQVLQGGDIEEIRVQETERGGEPIVQAIVYPSDKLRRKEHEPERLKLAVRKIIERRAQGMASFKLPRDIVITDTPLEKTSSQEFKRRQPI